MVGVGINATWDGQAIVIHSGHTHSILGMTSVTSHTSPSPPPAFSDRVHAILKSWESGPGDETNNYHLRTIYEVHVYVNTLSHKTSITNIIAYDFNYEHTQWCEVLKYI